MNSTTGRPEPSAKAASLAQTERRYRYAIVSPAKDEEAHAARTIESVAAQSVQPVRWVIVDDGSRDGTAQIAERYAEQYEWITVQRIQRDRARHPGPAVIAAFNAGLPCLADIDYDFLVKLDLDLVLPPDYFEKLLARFELDEKLGIASGVYLELWGGKWEAVHMPAYHAAGCSKVMRRECFLSIGGYCPDIGWDSIDEIRARARGWNTCHFRDLTLQHLRQEGRGVGMLRTWKKNGIAYYLMGGSFWLLPVKAGYRMIFAKPVIFAGLAIFWGYWSCVFTGRQRLVSGEEASLYRKLQRSRFAELRPSAPGVSPVKAER